MLLRTVIIVLAIVSFGTIIAGRIIISQDIGSCPSNRPGCFHTFPGTDIRIAPTGEAVDRLGLLILAGALVVGVAGYVRRYQARMKPGSQVGK